ncbi:hypothetical protein Tco_0542440 [Tanacetum coccineum]
MIESIFNNSAVEVARSLEVAASLEMAALVEFPKICSNSNVEPTNVPKNEETTAEQYVVAYENINVTLDTSRTYSSDQEEDVDEDESDQEDDLDEDESDQEDSDDGWV